MNCFRSAPTATPDSPEPRSGSIRSATRIVIFLTNVVHPHRGKSLTSLRSRVATIVAASFGITAPGVKLTGYNETIVGPGTASRSGAEGAMR